MEEDIKPSALSNPNQTSPICGECNQNPSKYKCPACSFHTCSLACVKSHKQRTTCSGKRSRIDFVPLAKFDDKVLISDYSFLEETKRVSESAQRLRDGLCSKFGFKMPLRLKQLRNAAFRQKTRLWLLPGGMSRRHLPDLLPRRTKKYEERSREIQIYSELQITGAAIFKLYELDGIDEDEEEADSFRSLELQSSSCLSGDLQVAGAVDRHGCGLEGFDTIDNNSF